LAWPPVSMSGLRPESLLPFAIAPFRSPAGVAVAPMFSR
jgi:hypothetical protein